MATIHEYDTVTLRHAHGRWLPGTTGAVLETFGQDAALVELVGPDGASLDMLTVPLTDLDPVQPPQHHTAPVPIASLAETIEDPTSRGLCQLSQPREQGPRPTADDQFRHGTSRHTDNPRTAEGHIQNPDTPVPEQASS